MQEEKRFVNIVVWCITVMYDLPVPITYVMCIFTVNKIEIKKSRQVSSSEPTFFFLEQIRFIAHFSSLFYLSYNLIVQMLRGPKLEVSWAPQSLNPHIFTSLNSLTCILCAMWVSTAVSFHRTCLLNNRGVSEGRFSKEITACRQQVNSGGEAAKQAENPGICWKRWQAESQ